MKHLAIFFVSGLILLTGNIYAQKTAGATKFTSVYTNLDKDCKTLRGGDGQDDAYDCKGVGGYRIYVGSAAAAQAITIEKTGEEEQFPVGMQDFDWDQTKIKVEWRLADGKPFAVIIRTFKYGDEKKNEFDYWGKKIGEELTIVGLKGFQEIDFTVDTKTPAANAKARELADNGYLQKRKK
jgi:hypothetical protein